LRRGPSNYDPNSPLLPDPLAVDAMIADWVVGVMPQGGIVALSGVDQAGPDELRALRTVVRTANDRPLALLLGISGRAGTAWAAARARLADEVGLIDVASGNASTLRAALPELDVAEAMRWCRLGAQDAGAIELIKAMAGTGADQSAAWLCLASVQLRRDRDLALAEVAARRVLAFPGDRPTRRRARRLLMLVRQKVGAPAEVAQMGAEAERDARTLGLRSRERPWLLLDAALGCRVDAAFEEHLRFLEEILAGIPTTAGTECRAIAHAWRAGANVFSGRLHLAPADQRAAIDLLSEVPDRSRRLLLGSRLGEVLFALGDLEAAAAQLEEVGRDARSAGELDLAAAARSGAVAAWSEMEDPTAARRVLEARTPLDARVWRSQAGMLWRLRAEAALLLAERRWKAAAAAAAELAGSSRAAQASALRVRFGVEAFYLRGMAARACGHPQKAASHFRDGMRCAGKAALGERRVLEALGRRLIAESLAR
jgi:ATP/maltotriose-dependent transcriptional regulator MalT